MIIVMRSDINTATFLEKTEGGRNREVGLVEYDLYEISNPHTVKFSKLTSVYGDPRLTVAGIFYADIIILDGEEIRRN